VSDGRTGSAAYGARADILILGENPLAVATAMAAIQGAGHRATGPVGHVEAMDLVAQGVGRTIVLAADTADGTALDPLLATIESAAEQGRCSGLVMLPVAMIDRVAAAISHPAIELLCDPTAIELASALTLQSVRLQRVSDLSGDETRRLRDLSEEVGRIARALASLSEETRIGQSFGERRRGYEVEFQPEAVILEEENAVKGEDVRRLIRARRLRARFFDAELFADPAWDMLLDLAAARLEGAPVAVSSLCIAAAVPPTTALRWIRMMSEQGLFVRTADPMDGRRVYIELSERVANSMTAYLAAVRQTGLMS
jgi:hypothetical protein